MAIPFKSFETLVRDQVTATQAASTAELNFNSGTVNLALVQANAAMGIYLEYLINAVLALTRAQTSVGADLDSWMAQFNLFRLPATPSTGNVTFSRFTTTGQALIPVGTVVKTTDFSVQFSVIADPTNPNFSPSLQAYVMTPSVGSTLAKVECSTTGVAGNVAPNQITFISSPIPGVDTVTNLLAFTNGKATESDEKFRARFVLYINSLSRAVLPAYNFVLDSIPEITRYNVVENKLYNGDPFPGYVYSVIDDGTGTPSPDLIERALAAIQKVRGLAIRNDVFAPTVVNVTISVDLSITTTISETTMETMVQTTLAQYINTLPFNNILPYSRLFEVIYDTSATNILNVSNLVVNGGTADLPTTPNQIFLTGIITVNFI